MTRTDILDALADIGRRLGTRGHVVRITRDEDGRVLQRTVRSVLPGEQPLTVVRQIVRPKHEKEDR